MQIRIFDFVQVTLISLALFYVQVAGQSPIALTVVIGALLLLAVLLTAVFVRRFGISAIHTNDMFIQRLHSDLDRKQGEIDALQKRLDERDREITWMAGELSMYKDQSSRLEFRLENAGETITIKDEIIGELQSRIEVLEVQVRQLSEDV